MEDTHVRAGTGCVTPVLSPRARENSGALPAIWTDKNWITKGLHGSVRPVRGLQALRAVDLSARSPSAVEVNSVISGPRSWFDGATSSGPPYTYLQRSCAGMGETAERNVGEGWHRGMAYWTWSLIKMRPKLSRTYLLVLARDRSEMTC